MDKRQESKELEHLVNEWKRGNKIEIPLHKFKSEYEGLPAVRCYICDWSPSNQKSLYHPECFESYSGVRIVQEDDGKSVCSACLNIVHKMNKAFEKEEDQETSKYLLDKDVDSLDYLNEIDSNDMWSNVYDAELGTFSGSRKRALRYE